MWRIKSLARSAPPHELVADFSQPVARAIAQQTAQFNEAVFREDQLACDCVQAGLASVDDTGLLGLQEDRVRRFHDAYLAGIK